jgi:hypothetical protein
VAGITPESLAREVADGGRRGRGRARDPDGLEETGPPPEARARGERRQQYAGQGDHAERELLRVLLHYRHLIEGVAERVGGDSFRDVQHSRVYEALIAGGADQWLEQLAEALDPEDNALVESLLEESGGLEFPDRLVEDFLRKLQARDIDLRLREIDRELPLATGDEQDSLIREKQKLREELTGLGIGRWKSFGGSRN